MSAELISSADRKLKSFSRLFSNDAYHDAAELYVRAGRLLKLEHKPNDAGIIFEKVAKLYLVLKEEHEAVNCYSEAVEAYKKADNFNDAIRCLQSIVEFSSNTYSISKSYKELAILFEKNFEYEEAIKHYKEAYNFSDSDNSKSACLVGMAKLYTIMNDFTEATSLYTKIGEGYLADNMMVFSAKKYLFRAILCYMADEDMVEASKKTKEYNFTENYETFIEKLMKSVEEMDVETFEKLVTEFDSHYQLNREEVHLLLAIKKKIPSESSLA